jgi:hypothetical protein
MKALQGRTRHAACSPTARCQQRRRLVLRCAAKNTPPTFLEDSVTKGLLSWASGVAISCSKLKPATFGGLRGMVASADIKTDDLLVSVPKQAAITLAPKQRNPCRDFVTDEYWGAAPWCVKLAIRLLYEQRLGASSSKQPYLASLPSRVDVPVLWRRELVQQLQYPHLVHQVSCLCGGVRQPVLPAPPLVVAVRTATGSSVNRSGYLLHSPAITALQPTPLTPLRSLPPHTGPRPAAGVGYAVQAPAGRPGTRRGAG